MKTQHKHLLQRTYLVLVFGFMYLPIAVLIAYSFNENKSRAVFTGFSLKWYASLFHNEMILSALGLSLVLAFVSAIIATVLGTLATIGINSLSRKALLIAHITFNVPYVIFNVGPKLRQLDGSLYNAALDLGCTPRQAFFKVILPQLSPAVMSAFLICLTYSIDDFMISYFNCGTMQTLPIAIYSMTRKKVSPEINALSAIIFLVILAIILTSNAMDSRAYKRNQKAIRRAAAEQ